MAYRDEEDGGAETKSKRQADMETKMFHRRPETMKNFSDEDKSEDGDERI